MREYLIIVKKRIHKYPFFHIFSYNFKDGERVIWEDEDRAILIMNFIALSMPEDFTYEVANKKNEKINNG